MTTFIESERLFIKAPKDDDIAFLTDLMRDPDVMRYIGSGGPRSDDQILETHAKALLHYEKYQFSVGCVFEKNANTFVGRAGLFHLGWDDTQPEIEVGYSLHKRFWGKGYATELAKAIIAWGFQHLPVPKLVAVTFPENMPSRHVLEKAGMRYIGMTHCYDIDATKYEITR